MKVSKGTVARTIVLALALINAVLLMLGYNTFDLAEDVIYEIVSAIAAVGASVACWWKNNSFTRKAREADELLKISKVTVNRKDPEDEDSEHDSKEGK